MNNCQQTLFDDYQRNMTFQSGNNQLHKKQHFPPISNMSQIMHLSSNSPQKKQMQKFKLNHKKYSDSEVTEAALSLRTTERVSARTRSQANNLPKNKGEKKNSFQAILVNMKEKKLDNLRTRSDFQFKSLFHLQKKGRNSSNFKISEIQNQEYLSGESRIRIGKHNVFVNTPHSVSFHEETYGENSENQQKQANALKNMLNISTKDSGNFNLLKSFNFSDKSKISSRNSLFKIAIPRRYNQSKGRFSNVNTDSLSALGQTSRVDQTPVNRYSNCSTVYKSGSQLYSPKLSLVKNYKPKGIKPSRHLIIDKGNKDNGVSIKNLIKNENIVEMNINNSKNCKKMNSFKREDEENHPVFADVTNKSKHFETTTINFEEEKSSYFTPKSYAEIKRSALERYNKNFFKSTQNKILQFEKASKEKIDFSKVMQTFKQSKYTAVIEQSNLKAKGPLNPKQEDVLEMRKFMNMNFSRYNVSELRSLHSAIIQNSKGDPIQLKKGLIVVMNLSGILIQEQKLHKFKVPTKSQAKGPQNNSCSFQKSMKDFSKNEDKTNIKKSFGLDERITKFKSDYFPLCKSGKNIPTMRSINTNRSMKKSQKHIKSTKNIPNKIGININALLNDNIKAITNFENFLEVYKQIETHYFKQTIIDYLNLILASTNLHYSTQKRKKTKIVKVRRQIASNLDLSQKDLSISSQQNNENEAIEKEDAQIGYNELYEAFKARSTSKGAQRIADTFQAKIKEQCKQDIRYIFHTSQNKSKHEQSGIKTEKAIQNGLNSFNILQTWKVKVGALYNLCYSDNQLCQIIYDYYVKQLSPVLQNNRNSSGMKNPINDKKQKNSRKDLKMSNMTKGKKN